MVETLLCVVKIGNGSLNIITLSRLAHTGLLPNFECSLKSYLNSAAYSDLFRPNTRLWLFKCVVIWLKCCQVISLKGYCKSHNFLAETIEENCAKFKNFLWGCCHVQRADGDIVHCNDPHKLWEEQCVIRISSDMESVGRKKYNPDNKTIFCHPRILVPRLLLAPDHFIDTLRSLSTL